MNQMQKKVYWGYRISHRPTIGDNLLITQVTHKVYSGIGKGLKYRNLIIGPITSIQKIAANMSIIWTENDGYAVYYTES